MKPQTLLAFAAPMAIASQSFAAIAGIDGLEWGQPRQAVQERHPNFEEWSEPDIDIRSGNQVVSRRYGLSEYRIGSCVFSLRLDFSENRLSAVILNQPASDRQDCTSSIGEQLNRRYGGPNGQGDYGFMKQVSWLTPDTSITFLRFQNGNSWRSRIVYKSRAATTRELTTPNRL